MFETRPLAPDRTSFVRHGARALVSIAVVALMLTGSLTLAVTPAAARNQDESGWTVPGQNLPDYSYLASLIRATAIETLAATGTVTDQDAGSASAGAGSGVDGSDGYSADEVVQVIYNAAAMYGQSGDDMLRVARCESVLDPYAVNGSSGASGLFQFLPSTWATTPYAGHDIFDAVANAEAAAWMWANGRRGEWSCQ